MKINENWRIDVETNGGVALVFAEKRNRKKIGKDKKPTGETEDYFFEDKTYHQNVHQGLKSYLIKSLENSIDVKSCIAKIEQSMLEIKNLSF